MASAGAGAAPREVRELRRVVERDLERKRKADAARRRKFRNSACRICRRWAPTLCLVCLALPRIYGSGDFLRGINKGIGAVASLADDVAMAAGTVVEAGANLSVQVASVTLAAVSSSKSVADDAWQGVDLIDVHAESGVVRIAAASNLDLALWVENGGGGALPAPMLAPTSRLIRSLSVRLPLLDFHNSSFDD